MISSSISLKFFDHDSADLGELLEENPELWGEFQNNCESLIGSEKIIKTEETKQENIKKAEELRKEKLSKKEVKIKICYLFHLIGDLHQPLHIGYGSDKGGNSFQLTFNSKKTNLHGLYDYGIIEYKKLKLKKCLKETNYTTQQIDAIQQDRKSVV